MKKQLLALAGAAAMLLAAGGAEAQVTTISGEITSDRTLTRDQTYVLQGAVFVRAPATLFIEPGTTIVGESASNGTLIIDRGAKLLAKGTAELPIVFTSDQPVGSRARGDWGGLILNGFAPLNVPGGIGEGEGATGAFGGTDPADDSGEFGYLRVEFAGTEFSPDNELNGIAFQGVGAGTFVDYVQVHFNRDDGLEFFGGTVSVKHAYCTGIGDDSFDWTDGWTGRGQFWIGQQRGDDADQGFEGDNNAENNDLTPRAFPRVYNFTLVGAPDNSDGSESDLGMLLREGTAGNFHNGIVIGFKEEGLAIDNRATFTQLLAGELVVDNMIFFGNGGGNGTGNFSTDANESPAPPITTLNYATTIAQAIRDVDPMLTDAFGQGAPDYRPLPGSPALDGSVPVAAPPDDGFFEAVTYIGAMDGVNNWLAGWTTSAPN
jgi:hypothetical protein